MKALAECSDTENMVETITERNSSMLQAVIYQTKRMADPEEVDKNF